MTKKIIVKCCADCPNRRYSESVRDYWCYQVGKIAHDGGIIPAFCTLTEEIENKQRKG